MAPTKSWRKKNKKNKKNERLQSHIASPTGIANNNETVLGRPVCDRGAIPRTLVESNVVRSRLIILINEEIKEANGPDKIVTGKKK